MAFDGKVVIDGNEIDKIRNIQFGMKNKVDDQTTNPAGSTRNTLIVIEREHDQSNLFWEWAVSSAKPNRKNGKIELYDQDKTLLVAEFTNAFVHRYEIHTEEASLESTATQIREMIQISTEQLSIETPNGRMDHNDLWDKR